MKINNKKAIQC